MVTLLSRAHLRRVRARCLICLIYLIPEIDTLALARPAALTEAARVRALAAEEAAQRLPVRLRGVVVGEAEPDGEALVLHDGTEGIYLRGPRPLFSRIARGERIVVDGVTDPGRFAPIVLVHRVMTIGTGAVPIPKRVTADRLMAGSLDAQYVEIAGIVRAIEPMAADPRKSKLVLAADGVRLDVQVHAELSPIGYVDAEVRLRGICFNQHNANRQLLSPLLLVPRGVAVIVDVPPRRHTLAAPQPAGRLLQFAADGVDGHRVHVRGVVTHQRDGEFLWIRDGERGLRVDSRQRDSLRVGDEVDVLGFPARGEYTPVLEDAVFRRRGAKPAPVPVRLRSAAEALRHDADLVEIQARLLQTRPVQDGWSLVLEWTDSRIEAFVPASGTVALPSDWRLRSVVRATGICAVHTAEEAPLSGVWEPRAFKILLRSPDDLRVLKRPPWWTTERLAALFGGIAICAILATAALGALARHRLREEAARRAIAETEFAAILAERNRIAREFHDTLAQSLNAIAMQLELVKVGLARPPAAALRPLETAHRLVRSTLDDARAAIWHMRSQVLENSDLAGALARLGRQLTDGSGIDVRVRTAGTPRRLPPITENNLLRIGQEAIANAVKHAHAEHVDVALEFSDHDVRLSVRDDGDGFDATLPAPREGGFGLLGMRERAAQLHGKLAVRSAPGRGTEVSLSVLLPG